MPGYPYPVFARYLLETNNPTDIVNSLRSPTNETKGCLALHMRPAMLGVDSNEKNPDSA